MKVIERGHIYELENRSSRSAPAYPPSQTISFVNKEPGTEHDGVTTQEVLRALIDRTRHCNNCLPHQNNERIIHHLRMALTLHECRTLERRVEKGEIQPEFVEIGSNGHFQLEHLIRETNNLTMEFHPWRYDWDRKCSYDPEA